MRALGVVLVALAAFIGIRYMTRPKLQHFTPSEFGVWYLLMNADLLVALDEFREQWGAPVVISPVEGGIGRHDDSGSRHNVSKFGEVQAIDIFPKVPDGLGGYRYIETTEELQRAYDIAKAVGFGGRGVYTDTVPGFMLHVDVREDETMWVRADHDYFYSEAGFTAHGLVA